MSASSLGSIELHRLEGLSSPKSGDTVRGRVSSKGSSVASRTAWVYEEVGGASVG